MKTLLVTTPKAKIEAKEVRELVPSHLAGWQIEAVPSGSLNQTVTIPDVTLVQMGDETRGAEIEALIPRLVRLQSTGSCQSYILFSARVRSKTKSRGRDAQAQQCRFNELMTHVHRELPAFPNPDRVNVTFAQNPSDLATELAHICTKLDLARQPNGRDLVPKTPRPSALDRMKEVVRSTADLRVANGNLSAMLVAEVFGISLNQLAGWLKRTRQAVSKTPDADSLQPQLAFFERVARLRAIVPKNGFQKWLRMASPELDDKTPLDLLAKSEWQVLADFVDDMLTGAPD